MIKTNAMRILDKYKVLYEELNLDINEALDGVTCAKMLNLNIDMVFKTLVTVSKSKNYYVFVIPVNCKLDLKKAAKKVNEKNLEMLALKDLLQITGYVHGGCSPIGMKKVFKTVFDESALNYKEIVFSGGKIGYFVKLNVRDIENIIDISYENVVED